MCEDGGRGYNNGDIIVRGINTTTFKVGRMEICVQKRDGSGEWRAVCAYGWDEHAAMVACRQLFPGSGIFHTHALICIIDVRQNILSQALLQYHAKTLALGGGSAEEKEEEEKEEECRDLIAQGMNQHCSNVGIKQALATRMQGCYVVSHKAAMCHAANQQCTCLLQMTQHTCNLSPTIAKDW